jgi:hypothetical protein
MFTQTVARALACLGVDPRGADVLPRRLLPMLVAATRGVINAEFLAFRS